MRALVTGASGLIGAHLVSALVGGGHDVRALVRHAGRSAVPEGVRVTVADLLDATADIDAACVGCDVVFHAAAYFAYGGINPEVLHDTAVVGTERVLRACARAGVERIVVTSSSVVFGYSRDAREIDEFAGLADSEGESPYVAAKIAQHRCALELGERLGLDVRMACPTMTLGPSSARLGPSNALIVAYLMDPLRCTYPGGCNLVSVRDVALGHVLIAERGVAGGSYLLGSANMTWREVHTAIAELAGVAAPRLELTHSLAYLAATVDEVRATLAHRVALTTREQAEMVGRRYWYSHAKAAEIGYSPMPARDALVETISWLAASPHVSRETRINMRLADEVYRFRARGFGG
jgi:dihydroflavonol-4-reductase